MAPQFTADRLKGREKAAVLLIALGADMSAEVLKHLEDEDVEMLTREVIRQQKVTDDAKDQVLGACFQDALAGNFIVAGGTDYAHRMLSKAFGWQKADGLISKVSTSTRRHPFDFLRSTDPSQLVAFIQGEQPQTVALILSHLKPNQVAAILSSLDDNLQAEVATRIATMDRTSPEVIEQVENVLKKKLSVVLDREYTSVGGAEFLAKVLAGVERGVERVILERLDVSNPELAAEVRKLVFTFEDMVKLDDRSLQRVLREVDFRDLALALRGCGEELKERMFKNLSSRAAEMLKDEMAVAGPVRIRNVDEAQQRIVAIVRRLDEAEEIYIFRGEDDVIF
ncbi:MAG: flagellar motor switch protein FliG [Bacteroidetes bacterium]|nr:flagellar motor switch protein FliG [Bacteroidota bacterium]MCL5025236.1 flagellar motor switch protein FliG [Chloroflexota bacterium]